MTNRTSPRAFRSEASSLRERAGRLRDATGRFIKRAVALTEGDQPEQASIPEGKSASPAAGTFSAAASTPDHADRGHPEAPERDRAEGGHEPRQEHDMGRHESFDPTNAIPLSFGAIGEALPAQGSPEAVEGFGAACRAVDAASRLSDADMEALHIAPGASLWTSDKVTEAQNGDFSRFMPREIEAARATPKARLEELLILTLRRELRMAEAVRSSRLRELFTLVYGDEPDPADEDEEPVPVGADPLLVAMVAEWQDVRRKLNDPAALDGPEADALGKEHSTRQMEIYLYPARSALDLLAKLPALRDELEDAKRGSANSLPVTAWTGLLADIERIAGAQAAQADDAELIALAGPWKAARRLYDQRTEEQITVSNKSEPSPGPAPSGGATPAYAEWRKRMDEFRERSGIADAEAASDEACNELSDIEDQIAALPARTLAGLRLKARVAERNSSIDVEWPEGLGDGLVRDLLALPVLPSGTAPLVDQILDGWRAWAVRPDLDESEKGQVEFDRLSNLRDALIDAAEALPAIPENVLPKALASAWLEYAAVWSNGQPREAYGTDGRLALDIDTAITGRLKTTYLKGAA